MRDHNEEDERRFEELEDREGRDLDFETYVRMSLRSLKRESRKQLVILEGNGKPGLIRDVHDLKTNDKWRSRIEWTVMTVLIGMIVLVIARVVAKSME